MIDIDGELRCYCDCAKGKKTRLKITCLHIQLVNTHPDEFGDVLYNGEEPVCVFIRTESQSLIFSIASQSGSTRHHSHKRTIVSGIGSNEWKCQACIKDMWFLYFSTAKS